MYLSLVLLKIWVSDTLFPVDISPSMVSIVDNCPATYNAQPSHSIWSPWMQQCKEDTQKAVACNRNTVYSHTQIVKISLAIFMHAAAQPFLPAPSHGQHFLLKAPTRDRPTFPSLWPSMPLLLAPIHPPDTSSHLQYVVIVDGMVRGPSFLGRLFVHIQLGTDALVPVTNVLFPIGAHISAYFHFNAASLVGLNLTMHPVRRILYYKPRRQQA